MILARMTNARRTLLLSALFITAGSFAVVFAQSASPRHYWIYLDQQTPTGLSPQQLGISERAMKRRAKVLPSNRLIDQFDYPIPTALIGQIQSTGAKIRTSSRWLNAVSVEATDQQLRTISTIPTVISIAPVFDLRFRKPEIAAPPSIPRYPKLQKGTALNYGQSFDQLNNINIVALHSMGIIGSGVVLGMLDDGFNNHTTHVALKNIHVIAEYDFVQQDSNTSLAPGEYVEQGIHGAGTLSSIAGFDDGTLIGGAFGVSVILAKTEIDSVEIHQEEDNFVAGLEWMERLGADIASSSLGYRDFDTSTYSYLYAQLDGHTAIVSKAATVAAQKGLLLVTAMGNEGGYQTGSYPFALGTIVTPADADSILSVGATSLDGSSLASFSGTGPTADGRTKPEVVAPGENVFWAFGNSTDLFWTVQGTSAATPLTASAAALILSAHPELTPMQVRQALMSTAVPLTASYPSLTVPNNFYGSGFINAYDAVLYNGLVFSNIPIITAMDSVYIVTTWIASKTSLVSDSLAFYYRYPTDLLFTRATLVPGVNPHEFRAIIPSPPTGVIPVGYLSARDLSGRRTSPFDAPGSLFTVQPTSDSLRQFYPSVGPGSFVKMRLLVPGETAAPGTTTGKIGTPSAQTSGSAFNVTVNAVDANWNVVSSTDVVGITSSDANATLPANAALVAGTKTFSVTLKTLGTPTVTATDITNGSMTANTSPAITIDPLPPNYIPADYTLEHNCPNPFNATTTIQFYTPTTANVELAVFSLLGQRVKTLFDGAPAAGWNIVRWNDAKDDYGRSVSSGVYFARLKTPRSVLTLKLLYVK